MILRYNLQYYTGWSPLHIAALCRDYHNLNLCEHLLDRNGDKIIRDEIGKTPQHYAAHNGNLVVLRILIENALDKNPRFCEVDLTET